MLKKHPRISPLKRNRTHVTDRESLIFVKAGHAEVPFRRNAPARMAANTPTVGWAGAFRRCAAVI